MSGNQLEIFTPRGSSYEENFLQRSVGSIVKNPDMALTELVANAWDAGATKVDIIIPERNNDLLTIEDDGVGMSHEHFLKRWMTLGYDRITHQGIDVEFPSIRSSWKRKAYGRNGIGRHSMLCFSDTYKVKTCRDGEGFIFTIKTDSGKEPFIITNEEKFEAGWNGTKLEVIVQKRLPNPDDMRNILSARFLHDPNFRIFVNGSSVSLLELPGFVSEEDFEIEDIHIKAIAIDTTKTARTMQTQGAAFWVNNRLVGEPSWILGRKSVVDGRTQFGKKFSFIFKSDDLNEHILPDWSGFKRSEKMDKIYSSAAEYINKILKKFYAEHIDETKKQVLRANKKEIKDLSKLARLEVEQFLHDVINTSPVMPIEYISPSIHALINLEKTRTGKDLLEKLCNLNEDDVHALNKILDSWSVRDALIVLDEIDNRISIIEAIKSLSSDESTNELKTLHPLITQARWLFGPEFESTEYVSNSTIINVIKKLFKSTAANQDFLNHLKRPDLVIVGDSTLSATVIEEFDQNDLVSIKNILLIELKKGGSTISRDEMNQAIGYVEDILHSGSIVGNPNIKAYVVGHSIDSKLTPERSVGGKDSHKIVACTYEQLVRTAQKRMFKLRERLNDRYENPLKNSMLSQILNESEQLAILPD